MQTKLDKTYLKIISNLDLNARITDSKLAKQIGVSNEVVGYRIKQLQSKKIISRFTTLINTMQLGYLDFRVLFKLTNTTIDSEKQIINYLSKKVNWCAKIAGKYDLGIMIFVKDITQFEIFLDDLLSNFGSFIDEYWVSIMTKIYHFKKDYLLSEKSNNFLLTEKVNKSKSIDELDHKILSLILDDARLSNIRIASKLGINEKLVRDRIKRMEKENIILGYSPFLNISKLGLTHYKVFFYMKNSSKERKKALETFALYHPKIIFIVKAIGGTDFEIELQVKNNKELYELIDEIRTQFNDIIKDYFFVEYIEEYKLNYLPEFKE